MNNTQFSAGVWKKYMCDWLLKRHKRNYVENILETTTPNTDSTNTSQPITLSPLLPESKKKYKRRKKLDDKKNHDTVSKLNKKLTGEVSDVKAKNLVWEEKYNCLYNKKLELTVKMKKLSNKISCLEEKESKDLHMSDTTL